MNLEKNKTILITEDDEAIRESLRDVLSLDGYDILEADDGDKALKVLDHCEKAGKLPDLILLDLRMPIKDGYSFRAEQLANPIWKTITTVVLSADGQIHNQIEKLQVSHVLKKPIGLFDLLKTVATLLA